MNRRHFTFDCDGSRLVGTIDAGSSDTGLLIVSGGNEVRAGPWNSYAALARQIASAGFPVMRFDRRGVGDSDGVNEGYRCNGQDIAAALSAFRNQMPYVKRIVGFGNCDGASALMLTAGIGLDALVLSNPWTIEQTGDTIVPAVARAHYRRRLTDLGAIKRLLTGQVSILKLVKGLSAASQSRTSPNALAAELHESLSRFKGSVDFLVADRDRTALAFLDAWDSSDSRIKRCANATHSYVERHAMEWLVVRLTEALQRASA